MQDLLVGFRKFGLGSSVEVYSVDCRFLFASVDSFEVGEGRISGCGLFSGLGVYSLRGENSWIYI